MNNPLKVIQNLCSEYKDCKLLLAVSGGLDSMVLASVFLKLEFKFSIAHVNYNLRGIDSIQDEEFVRQYSSGNNIPFYSKSIHLTDKNNLQANARKERYKFFEFLKQQHNIDYIVTAHHANDQIESFLLALSRGSRLSTLKGMEFRNGYFLKPFLHLFKEDLETYAKENFIFFRTDSSNNELYYDRNFFRNKILPEWRKRYPATDRLILRSIENLKHHHSFFNEAYSNWKLRSVQTVNQRLIIAKPEPHHELFFKEYLSEHLFHQKTINELYTHLNSKGAKYINQFGLTALVDRDTVILDRELYPDQVLYIRRESQTIELKEGRIKIGIIENFDDKHQLKYNKCLEVFDLRTMEFPLILRYWRSGDKIKPFGMGGHSKKIQDVFSDVKMNKFSKHITGLIAEGENILWIAGVLRSDLHKINPATREAISFEWLPNS